MTIPGRLADWFRSLTARWRWLIVVTAAAVIVLGAVGVGFAAGGGGKQNVSTGAGTSTTRSTLHTEPSTTEPATVQPATTEPDTVEPDTVEPDTIEPDTVEPDTVEPDTVEPDTSPPGPATITADSLMSMIGRPPTEQEFSTLSKICARDFVFRQDVHCEEEAGFGLSFDGDSVREVYLYNYRAGDRESFPGSLPGGVTWRSTLSDITGTLGQPECVDSILGFDAVYTIDDYDVDYNVEASHYPTARLLEITIRAAGDRSTSCHTPTWEVGS